MSPTPSAGAIIRGPGEGERAQQANAAVTIKLDAHEVPGGLSGVIEFDLPAGFGPPMHVHHREDELLHVTRGSLRVVCGDHDETLGTGGFAFLPRGVPHTFRVVSEQPARMLVIFTPGGAERLFVDARPGEFEAAAERLGIEFTGPPLA